MRAARVVLLAMLGASVSTALIGGAQAGSSASAPNVVCPRLDDVLVIEFGRWGGAGTPVRQELFALAGSAGAERLGGWIVYASATPTKAETDRACRRTPTGGRASTARLSKPFYYRTAASGNVYFRAADGELVIGETLHLRSLDVVADRLAVGASYRCAFTGRATARVTHARAGRIVGSTLRVRIGSELLAHAVLRDPGESFFRVAKRCEHQ